MWTAGQTVLDRYALVEQLAEGGGGETWAANGPHGPVAIKRIHAEDGRRFRDLIREAQLLRELRHPNVVSYREFSDRPDEDCAILVTDFVDGGDLEQWIAMSGPRPVVEVAELGLQIVAALEALADLDVLHRDLKPTNVLVSRTGGRTVLRVTDFGISRPLHEGVARTVDRSLTPLYAAPEQHVGGALTRAADLYALGGVLAFLATGLPPTQGGMPTGEPALDPLLERLMALAPDERPTLAQTRAALEALRGGNEEVERRASERPRPEDSEAAQGREAESRPVYVAAVANATVPVPDPPDPSRRRRLAAAGGALTGAGLLVLLGRYVLAPAPPAVMEPTPLVAVEPAPVELPAPVEPAPVEPPAAAAAPAERPRTAVLFVNSRPWSHVIVDGRRRGRTSDLGTRIEVPAGAHTVRLEAEGGLVWEGRVEIRGERRLCVNLRTGTELAC